MDQVVDLFNSLPAGTWEAVIGAIGVSTILQSVKKWLSVQSDKVISLLLLGLSFAASAIDYLMQATAADPKVLGAHTATVLGVSQLAYRFLVKPTSNGLQDIKENRARKARIAAMGAPVAVDTNNVPIVTATETSSTVVTVPVSELPETTTVNQPSPIEVTVPDLAQAIVPDPKPVEFDA